MDQAREESFDPRQQRQAQPLSKALPLTIRWFDELPPAIRPSSLLREFPRIANMLAASWADVPAFVAYMATLIHDRRGGRRGFPPGIRIELLTLHAFYNSRYVALGDAAESQQAAMS